MSVIGLRVGPFEVESEVPVPEPGRWYRAVRTGLTRKQPSEALVRVLDPEATADERQALQRAYENLKALEDTRVPAPIAYYEGIGALALASVEGTSLDRLVLARKDDALPLAPSTLLDIALELAETLQHANHKGMWHGHLWPGLVQIGSDGKLWVWGFGPGHGSDPPESWLAPERARGLAGTPAIDQWGLGAFIAALVTGKPPWSSADPRAESRKGDIEGIVGPVESQWPALGRLLRKMLDPQPEARFPSLQPVRQELLALSRKAGGVSERHRLGSALAQFTGRKATRRPTPHAKDEIALTPVPAPPRGDGRGPPVPSLRRQTPAPAQPRAAAPMAIVQPHVPDDVPIATTGKRSSTPAPAPGRVVASAAPLPSAPEVTEERLATEIIDDNAPTEMHTDQEFPAEREPTEMTDVSSLKMALVAPVEEPVEDPISESRDALVRLPDINGPPKDGPMTGKEGEDVEEDIGDAATEQWSAEKLTTVLKDLDQPSAVTPPPAPDKGASGRSAPVQKPPPPMPPLKSLPPAVLQETQPPQPPPLKPPVPVDVELDSSPNANANPTMVPLTDPGTGAGTPSAKPPETPIPTAARSATGGISGKVAPAAGPKTDTGIGTDAGFFKSNDDIPVAKSGPASAGPGGLPAEPPPVVTPLPERKLSPVLIIAPILAILLLVSLVLLAVWQLFLR